MYPFRIYSKQYKKYLTEEESSNLTLNDLVNTDKYIIEKNTGVLDIDNNPIYKGDIITKLYVTPLGDIDKELDLEFKHEVDFFNGSFGIFTEIKFIPLLDFITKSEGEYISNKGNKFLYAKKSILKVIGNSHEK